MKGKRLDLKIAWIVYRKELRDTLRDRRTLAMMIMLPLVLYPLLSVGASEFLISHELARRSQESRVLVRAAPVTVQVLAQALAEPDALLDVTFENPQGTAVQAPGDRTELLGHYDIVVEVDTGFGEALAGESTASLRLYYDGASDRSNLAKSRIDDVLVALSDKTTQARLTARSLAASLILPVNVEAVDLATRVEIGRHEAAKSVPFMIMVMTLLGSFYPAIDLTAGERERGTLEPLLASPAPRLSLVAGKYLTVCTISALTALLNVLCMAAAALWIVRAATRANAESAGLDMGEILSHIPWSSVALAMAGLAGATLLFSGVMMAIATLARSFKEAQNLLTPVHMVLTIPGIIAFLPETKLTWATALIPVSNVALLLKGCVAGDLAFGPAALALVVIFGCAALGIVFAARMFSGERMLFGGDEPGAPQGWRAAWRGLVGRRRTAGKSDTVRFAPDEALGLFAACAVALLLIGAELQAQGTWGLGASLWLCLALPTWLAARRSGRDPARALGVVGAPSLAFVGTALLGMSLWVVLGVFLLPIQQWLFPTPEALTKALESIAAPTDASLGLVLFAAALSPAICEELLCRGALTRAFQSNLGKAGAIVVSAALFAILHISLHRFMPTFLLGVVLGACTVVTGSILPGMLLHGLHNAVILLASQGGPIPEWVEQNQMLSGGIAVAVAAAGAWCVHWSVSVRKPPTAPPRMS